MPEPVPVLIIEDEEAVMSFIQAAMERSGYRTVGAPSGVDGLKLLEAGDFKGVISDMRTPGGVTGADVHDWIVTHRPELAAKIIFITGDTVNDETQRLLQSTGAPCIEKPFRVAQLISVVQARFGKP
jgi:CheY-like chemotaxis protein